VSVDHAGGTGAVTIRWHIDGFRVAAFDDLESIALGCSVGP